jgi:acyl transferase domain-containing protein/acyl-CoA synthetase (AMP-forming)/AMP-acid ligase II/SAM-dependent methyltransferase/acyl carrier protein
MALNLLSDPPQAETLIELLRGRAVEGSEHGFTFLPDGHGAEVRLPFHQLDVQARGVARILQHRELAGQRALLCYPPGLDFLAGFFGCLYAGVVAVPLYPPRANRFDVRLESVMENAAAAVALTSTKVFRDVPRLTGHAPRLKALPWLDTCEIPASEAEHWSPPRVGRDDLAVLQYTSGSTGLPKGVMLTHAALLHNLARMWEILGLTPQTDGVCWLPAFHDMGLIGNLLQSVFCGISLCLVPPTVLAQDPLLWLQTISARRAYVSGGPTFAFRHCLQRRTPEKCAGLDLSCWKVAYVGAESVSAETLDRFAEAFAPYGFRREAFFPCYGLAEATLMVTGGDRMAPPVVRSFARAALGARRAEADDRGQPMVGCGGPLTDLSVRIVDPDTGQALPEGRIGEIWVSGPSVALGYWDRPEESGQTFQARCDSDPGLYFLRTGDLGFFWQDELFVSGRCKDLIISRGRNFYPQDLEEAAADACPELQGQAGAAFVIETAEDAELVILHEVPRGYKPGTGQQLFDRIRRQLAELFDIELHKLVLVKVGTIPRASSGKVQRQECARRYQVGEFTPVEEIAAPTESEPLPSIEGRGAEQPTEARLSPARLREWLVAWLVQNQKIPAGDIDVYRPWSCYGISSLVLSNLAADLQKLLQRPLSPTLLYSAPTIDSLVHVLAGEAGPAVNSESGAGPREHVPIAVVGIGCRFPGVHGAEEAWRLFREGRCVIGPLPDRRWERPAVGAATTRGGYLDDVQSFDAPFFGIAPREAAFIDPQHRLLLEVTWEALEHAGIAADALAGRPVGVFMGVSTNDYSRLLLSHGCGADAYAGVGNAGSMAAHRLSYHLDLLGPSVAVDTACSSALVAVHLACQGLRSSECELALAGGVNLILTPELTEVLSRGGMLSPAGLCRTFDAAADGYVRGEGCGVVVLKPLPAAVRDGDRVLAVLEASAVNQDGKSNGITAPNGARQTELIRRVLRLAGRSPGDVVWVEAHGTGTALGDPIEFDALQAALGSASQPCALTSVKTNLGHLEAAAGIAGLIKAVLQVQHGEIVPHLHLENLNPHIGLAGTRFFIPREPAPWSDNRRLRLAGVSSFGFGGTNAHVLVAAGPESKDTGPAPARPLCLLPLSAKTRAALREMARRFADWLRDHPQVPLEDVCAAAGLGRCHFEYRLAVCAATSQEMSSALSTWAETGQHPACQSGQAAQPLAGRVAFLFTGQGAATSAVGRALYEICPVFRRTLDHCAEALGKSAAAPFPDVFSDPGRMERTDLAQPALFALGYALTQTWRAWGIEPAALLGHSVGEYTAACVAGVLSVEDGLMLIAERGRLMQQCPEGAMLTCFAPLEVVRPHLDRWDGRLEVAAINGPESIVVSGRPAEAAALREELAAHGIESRLLPVHRAFHSGLIEGALPGLQEMAATLPHSPPSIPMVSNVTGEFFSAAPSAGYWVEHARRPVQFAAGIRTLRAVGVTHLVEVGPDAVLCRLGPGCLKSTEGTAWLPSLRRDKDDWGQMLATLARLYVDGAKVNWAQVDGRTRRPWVDLPTYPFERFRYWVDMIAPTRLPASAETTPGLEASLRGWRPWSNWRQRLPRRTALDEAEKSLADTLAPQVAALRARHRIEQYIPLREDFDRLAGAYVVSTLRQLAWSPRPGEEVCEELARRLSLVPPYERLLRRLLQMAAEDGWLARTATGWRVVRMPAPVDIEERHRDLLRGYPAFEAELKLAHRCALRMHQVMRGQEDPLDVLFGEEAASWTERLYRESPVAHFYNELVAGCVSHLAGSLVPHRPVHILEVGAGTGGTTAHVLPALPPGRVEYVFTDVSQLFVAQAARKLSRFPFVHYHTLDLEKSADARGFADGQFDLILAANVLHATPDLRRSLDTARRLLAPGGTLLLLEGTGPRRLLDLIFGLTKGWWQFADLELRPQYPLLSPAAWRDLLLQKRFQGITTLPLPDRQLPDPDQAVILARTSPQTVPSTCSGVERNAHAGGETPTVWLIAGAWLGLADDLTTRLERDGDTVLLLDEVKNSGQTSQKATVHVIDFTGDCVAPASCSSVWVVTRGEQSSRHTGQATDGVARFFVDLDPQQPADEQAECLYQALRHPDEQRVVVYRGGQRYVPTSREVKTAGKYPESASRLDRRSILEAPPSERRKRIDEYLRQQARDILSLEVSATDLDRPLQALGLDSLTAIHLRNRIEDDLGLSLSLVDFLKGLCMAQVGDRAMAALAEAPQKKGEATRPPGPPPEGVTPEKVDHLPVEKLDGLLGSLLERF